MSTSSDASLKPLSISKASDLSDSQWNALGFRNLAPLKSGLDQLIATSGANPNDLLGALSKCCDPDQAFSAMERWVEAGGPALTPDWNTPLFLEILSQLFAATPALSEYLIRLPQRTARVIQPVINKKVVGGNSWRLALREELAPFGPPFGDTIDPTLPTGAYNAQLSALRRMRVECMLQIAALDLITGVPLQDTVRALSDLADACIDAALSIAVERLRGRLGTIGSDKIPFVVYALGKLGGRELNYSSDIDLVFAYEGTGETSGGTRAVDFATYFTSVGEELSTILDKVTEDGRVYRVDLRLRPHGSVGPLVNSFEQMLNYYQTEGRTWERQAWLKARAVAGDIALGNKFLENISSFIFRRYLSLDAIGDIKALKRQIELSVAKRGESEEEVKLGRGGIRDVEFTVQFMQLLHGGEHPNVRRGNTLHALYELRREGLLSDLEVEPLSRAYTFMRHIEHRLQLYGDLQVHRLPPDPIVRRRVARSLGYSDTMPQGSAQAALAQDLFEGDRLKHCDRTREVFTKLFANLFRENAGLEAELSDLLLAPEPDVPQISSALKQFGFSESDSAARELIDLSKENLVLTAPSRTRKFFASIAPQLLKTLVDTGEPDDALKRFSRIVGSLGAKAVFYQMLNENPWLLKMTVDLAAWSQYLTDVLVANPGLFDELVDALQTAQSKTVDEMTQELARITQGGGDIADTLRAYRAGELLRIGVRDLIHEASLQQTQSELSDLAQAILRIQLQRSVKSQRDRRGDAKTADGKTVGFAVLAVGKFGGREMNYGSDLDVLYFYSEEGQTDDGMPAVTYFSELSQDLTRAMATPTSLGSLYELDARLRPNGTKGPLAQSLDSFKQYWKEGQLADWERLALTRARFVAGDEKTAERALHLLRSAVYSPLKDTQSLAKEVANMRRRLQEGADEDDLKRGRGGIMDIEFIAQYLQLIHGPAFPPLRQANTEDAIKSLVKFKKLSADDGKVLLEGYEFLRRMENRVRVVHGISAHKLPGKSEALRKLALRAGYTHQSTGPAEESLLRDYVRHTSDIRALFEKLVDKIS